MRLPKRLKKGKSSWRAINLYSFYNQNNYFKNYNQILELKKDLTKYKINEEEIEHIFSGEDDWLDIGNKLIDFSLEFENGSVKAYGFFDSGIVLADFESKPKGVGLGERALREYRTEFENYDIIVIKPIADAIDFWERMLEKGLIDHLIEDKYDYILF